MTVIFNFDIHIFCDFDDIYTKLYRLIHSFQLIFWMVLRAMKRLFQRWSEKGKKVTVKKIILRCVLDVLSDFPNNGNGLFLIGTSFYHDSIKNYHFLPGSVFTVMIANANPTIKINRTQS